MLDRRPLLLGLLASGLAGTKALQRARTASFDGKVAFVTGGSRGLGLLLARELAQERCRVVICARNEQELGRAATYLRGFGADVLTVVCDVGDQAQVVNAVERARQHFGRIDILVNNAGIIQVGPVESMTIQDFRDAMDVMYWGVLYPTIAVLPEMRERREGWIVNITSIGGKISAPHLIPYNAAKFAAVGLSEGLRAELAKDGISVTTIAPGLMRTGSPLNAFFKGQYRREFAWFNLGASLPIVSMDAERAARQIVRASKRGQAERILSFPAAFGARFHGLFPGTTANILGLVNRMLPSADGPESGLMKGHEAGSRIDSRAYQTATGLGRSAAARFNEYSEEPPAS